MATLTQDAFFTKWQSRFADNSVRLISEGDFREFAQDIKDSFSSALGGVTAITWKDPCLVVTDGNITLSGEQTIDNVPTSGSRVLVRGQSIASENGIYISAAGAWTRATDADTAAEIEGAAVGITSGDLYANSSWIQTTADVTLGSSNIVWHQIGFGVSSQNLQQVLTEGNDAFAMRIENVGDPVDDGDAVNKAWALANVGGTVDSVDDLPYQEPETVSTTTYVFTSADHLKIKKFTHTSGCTATIPAGLPAGWSTTVYRASGAGSLTLASAGTFEGTDNVLGTEETWASIVHMGSDVHAASGALGNLGLTVGTIDSQTKSANGGVLSGSSIYFQNADATYPGLVSIGTQAFSGSKSFSGNIAIGTTTANAPLQFASETNRRKIVLYESGDNDHQTFGFGLNAPSDLLQYNIAVTNGAHVFYAGTSSSTSNELMRLKGTGELGVGISSPTAVLHLKAGSTTVAPIILTSGTAKTTPADGAIEYHSSHLYFTIGSTRYQLDQQLTSSAQTIAGVKTFSSTPIISSTPSTSTTAGVLGRNTSTGAIELRTDITSGTYTPTLTNSLNITSSTAYATQYMRVGNVVHVSGMVEIDATSVSAVTQLGVSLPIASNFAQNYQCAGTFYTEDSDANANGGAIKADVANDRATFSYFCLETATRTWLFTFTYQVI